MKVKEQKIIFFQNKLTNKLTAFGYHYKDVIMTIQRYKNSIPEFMNRKYEISFPVLTPDNFSQKSTKILRGTYREGGIRLEAEQINDKYVYHNYGQGSSQFSLAYGCAYIVSKMITLKKEDTKTKDVAVIGNTINALMTTLELSKRGHKVKLYTSRVSSNHKQIKNKNENSAGLQFWYPCEYDNCDPLKHQLVSKLSFQFMQDCISSNRYQSLKPAHLYCTGPKSEEILENITDFISKQVGPVNLYFSNQKLEQFVYFSTILIDTDLFVDQIITELRLRNVTIEERTFNSLHEILQLNEQFIYNCLGVQNSVIFGDKKVNQIQNFNIIVANPDLKWQQNIVIWYSSENDQQPDYAVYISKKKIQIGTKNKQGRNLHDKLQQNSQSLIVRAYHYLKERTIKPYKL